MESGLSKNSGEVAYLDEIVSELSEEFGISEKEMKELCSLSMDYVKYLTKQKDTTGIIIPTLGILYFNRSLGQYFKKAYTKAEGSLRKELDNINYRLEKIKGVENKHHRKKPLLYKFKNILKKKGIALPRIGSTLGQRELWSTVSKIQNEINNE